jgi:hypothetical protein
MSDWREALRADPTPWLLSEDDPAVRHATLRTLIGREPDDEEAHAAGRAALASDPIATILAAQQPEGYWVKPGAGYGPKYTGTVWQLIFLDQLRAPADDPRVRSACEYVLAHTQSETGGFVASGNVAERKPPPAYAIHCLHGNLLSALLGFGWLDDPRVAQAIDWQARSITGVGFGHFYRAGTRAPGFCCSANDGLPCAWGAVKAMLALGRIPSDRRSPEVRVGIHQGTEFLLSRDPAVADYPMPDRATMPSSSWYKPQFPLGYVTDVLQTLEALCAVGAARDPRLAPAVEWLLAQQDDSGRWKNRYSYHGKMHVDIDKQGQPSKWVTLRACRVLRAVA